MQKEIVKCFLCLRKIGFGSYRIAKTTGVSESMALKWGSKCKIPLPAKLPNKPHYECFRCLRIIGLSHQKTAKLFKVSEQAVRGWFKIKGRQVVKPVKPKTELRPKIAPEVVEFRKRKSRTKRKITMYFRGKVWKFFKRGHHHKSTPLLIGCSREHFISHIKSLMRPGMTDENYGKVWHLDHIKPCKGFDLYDEKQRRECFHWTNYQPLFAQENLRKSSKQALS